MCVCGWGDQGSHPEFLCGLRMPCQLPIFPRGNWDPFGVHLSLSCALSLSFLICEVSKASPHPGWW